MNNIPTDKMKEIDQITGKDYDIIEAFPVEMFPTLLNSIADDLQDEEIAAVTGQIGCYALRLAKVACYNYPQPWKKRKVLPTSFTQDLRKRMLAGETIEKDGDIQTNYRVETVLSVFVNHAQDQVSTDAYQYLCHAQEAWYGWCEKIDWIGVIRIKNDPVQNTMRFFFGEGTQAQTDSKQDFLLVRKHWSGDSHSATFWYVLSEDGTMKECRFDH